MNEIKHGSLTITQSVGNMDSVGEGSPMNAEVTKENLPPKKTRGRPKGVKNANPTVHTSALEKPWSKVRLGYGVTKSIGNFEFVRIDVSAEDYCLSDEKQKTWDELDTVVSERIQKCISEYERFRASKHIQPSREVIVEGTSTVSEESRKLLNKLIMNAARFGKIRYSQSLEKIKKIVTEEQALSEISKLENQDYSFFEGDDNGSEGNIESCTE